MVCIILACSKSSRDIHLFNRQIATFSTAANTSVNVEPMLDASNVPKMFGRLVPYVNVKVKSCT